MNVSVMIILVGYIKINKMNKMNKMKRGSRRNMSLGLLLLVVTLVCVVSHKFREGMDQKEVKKRLDKMEDKLDDIYEEVVGEGEERIKTGKYLLYDKGEYEELANKRIKINISKKGGNEYKLVFTKDFKDIKEDVEVEKAEYKLELFSDYSMFGKNVNSDKDTIIMLFDKGGRFFLLDDIFFVNAVHKEDFTEEVKLVKEKNDGKVSNENLITHFSLNTSKNEANRKYEEERVKEKR